MLMLHVDEPRRAPFAPWSCLDVVDRVLAWPAEGLED